MAERTAWRAIIQLNLIRSVISILEALHAEMNGTPIVNSDGDDEINERDASSTTPPIQLSEKHQLLKLRLTPLRRVEADLKKRVGAEAEEIDSSNNIPMYATPFDAPSSQRTSSRKRTGEFVVKSWKHVLERSQERMRGSADSEDATGVIAGCRDDIKALWEDPIVQDVLARRNIRLADSADLWVALTVSLRSFLENFNVILSFLGAVDRIATRTYDPSDDDVVRARLRTVGVQEHRLKFEQGLFPVFGSLNMQILITFGE